MYMNFHIFNFTKCSRDMEGRLPDICRGYDPRDRFNADETDLLWKATPTQTLNFKGQKCSGVGGLGSIVKSVSLSWWLVTRMVQKSYPCYLSENMLNPGASEEVIWICFQSSTDKRMPGLTMCSSKK